MEKIAVVELNESALKLSIFKVIGFKSEICFLESQDFSIGKEIEENELLSPKTKNDILDMLKTYRNMIEFYGVKQIFAVTTSFLLTARNYRGFIDEIYNNTGINFTILSDEDEMKYIFNSVISSIDSAKGVFVYVGQYSTFLVKYNRRAILDYEILPYGPHNINKYAQDMTSACEFMKEKVAQSHVLQEIDEETKVVGVGRSFLATGKIARKIQRYPLDLDNNYSLTKEVMKQTYEFVKELDLDKMRKIKGIDYEDADKIYYGLGIVNAVVESVNIPEITISTACLRDGTLYFNVLSQAQEKFSDLLTNSLETYYEFNKDESSINELVYDMSTLLFKQLKVMHKLPRFYLKPLRIASFMYNCGEYISKENYSKYSMEKILYGGLKGATHKELLIAAFIAVCQNLDDFSLSEWMKYKDMLTEEDLDAVRKLGIIVKLAVSLNASRKRVITDVMCDILGDSIIMKTVSDADVSFEILEGMKIAKDYKKVYKKSLQII